MSIIPDDVRKQLEERFKSTLTRPVHVTVYTKPGSSRLILPAGMGCPTCEDARQMAELLHEVAPDKVTVEVVDITRDPGRAEIDGVIDVPTMAISANADGSRIRFQGLPTGTEFPALIDAVERVSRAEHGLTEASVKALGKLTEPIEVLVFATPT